jgi:tRNA threonylcarbamoyladenosine biosynthesis protein TsaE
MQNLYKKFLIEDEFSLEDCLFSLLPWDRVFFYGDLGAGKSTFIRHLLRRQFDNQSLTVRSPTYTYYEKYKDDISPAIYHFDLYRIEDYFWFISIGGEEIMDNESNIMLIEWPELLEWIIEPTKIVRIELKEDGTREITIQ